MRRFLDIYCVLFCMYMETGIKAESVDLVGDFCPTSQEKLFTINSVSYFKLQTQEDGCDYDWAKSLSACDFFVGGKLAKLDDETMDVMERAEKIKECFWIGAKGNYPNLYWSPDAFAQEPVISRRWNPTTEYLLTDCGYICPQSWQIQVRKCFHRMKAIVCSKVEKVKSRIPTTTSTTTKLPTTLTQLLTSTIAVDDSYTATTTITSTKMAPTTSSELSTVTTSSTKKPTTVPKKDKSAAPAKVPKRDNLASRRILHGVRHVGGSFTPRLKATADLALTAPDEYACVRNCKGSCEAVNYGSSERTCLIFYDFVNAKKKGAFQEVGWTLWAVRQRLVMD